LILRAVSSLSSLLIYTILFAALRVAMAFRHVYLPADTETLWSLYARLFIACWVYLDRKGRGLSLPFEFEAFVFFGWPLFLPYYLYKTRGTRRGMALTFVTFAALVFVPVTAQVIVRLM
jgi:hypothetical protein